MLLHFQVLDALGAIERAAHLFGKAAQLGQIGTIKPHHHGRARASQHFLDAFAQVRQHIALQAGVSGDGGFDALYRCIVIGGFIEADPQFGEVGAVDFIALLGPADVRAEVAHAGDRGEFLRRADGDPVHRFD